MKFGSRSRERFGAPISVAFLIGEFEMSAMQTISVQVTPEAAKAYRKASVTERKKMEFLLSMRLISRSAQERGLTPEILDELLKK